jgi:hypothetical protein
MRLLSVGTGYPSSIPDALMSNRSLTNVIQSLVVLNANWNPDDHTIDIPVAVITRKSGGQV